MADPPRGAPRHVPPWALAIASPAFVAAHLAPVTLAGPAGSDKAGHVVLWAAMGLLVLWGRPVRLRHLPAIAITGAVLGMALEALQGQVPGRSPEALDIVADVVGAVLAGMVVLAHARLRHARPEP